MDNPRWPQQRRNQEPISLVPEWILVHSQVGNVTDSEARGERVFTYSDKEDGRRREVNFLDPLLGQKPPRLRGERHAYRRRIDSGKGCAEWMECEEELTVRVKGDCFFLHLTRRITSIRRKLEDSKKCVVAGTLHTNLLKCGSLGWSNALGWYILRD